MRRQTSLSFESPITQGTYSFGHVQSYALVTLLLPAGTDRVDLIIQGAQGSAVVPFSVSKDADAAPSVILLD